jgi:hypothetical protein
MKVEGDVMWRDILSSSRRALVATRQYAAYRMLQRKRNGEGCMRAMWMCTLAACSASLSWSGGGGVYGHERRRRGVASSMRGVGGRRPLGLM